jgi:hypothetical protein
MKKLLPFLACLLLCGAFTRPVCAQTPAPDSSATPALPSTMDPAKAAEIRKLLDLTGTLNLMNQMKTQMLESFKTQQPGVSPETWTRLESEMDVTQLLEDIIPLYDKYYTLDDLKAANAFYASPAGQHILANTPQLMRETMQVSQAWGRKIGIKSAPPAPEK